MSRGGSRVIGDWTDDAACSRMDVEVFYVRGAILSAPALAACRACPVRDACREHAESNNESYGIWGGLTARQRGWP
ncbi:WhiB family transcriptional regulator [Streptomyces sp. NPDC006487]|uniref:WhiB family transcriptional regulator n=1 Tax=Streptomyces sp. NPDC006487 TaxID=3364748 RepID=UPI0036CAD7CA